MQKILIIGAQNIDIFANSKSDYVLHDSNPSKIHMAFGGVGRNIASNLSFLGIQVDFLTVFGGDYFGQLAKKNLESLNINFKESIVVKDIENSIYLGVMDKANDLYLGLNDMDIMDFLDVSFFKSKNNYIEGFDILVIDNNLNQEALQYLLLTFGNKRIIMDAVSSNKVMKLRGLLSYITVLKLNMMELGVLSKKLGTQEKLEDLLEKGLNSIIVTNSAGEIYFKNKNSYIVTMPIAIEKIKNATGAGDAFLAGFIYGLLQSKSPEGCLESAKKQAYKCLKSPTSTIL